MDRKRIEGVQGRSMAGDIGIPLYSTPRIWPLHRNRWFDDFDLLEIFVSHISRVESQDLFKAPFDGGGGGMGINAALILVPCRNDGIAADSEA